jgi:hypothetical protein
MELQSTCNKPLGKGRVPLQSVARGMPGHGRALPHRSGAETASLHTAVIAPFGSRR